MAIRIIDILNMFKTGNKIPTKIKVKHGAVYDYYKWSVKDQWYVTYDDTTLLIIACPKDLLEEVEIIEDKEDKIENLPIWATTREDKEYTKQEEHILVVARKVSELIDKVNNMEK